MDEAADTPHDLAKLYPADGTNWAHKAELTVFEAVVLSLDIEPSLLEELAAQQPEVEPLQQGEPLHFGVQDADYQQRTRQLRLALRTNALAPVRSGDHPVRVLATSFISWAQANGWALPDWMADLATQSTSGSTNGSKVVSKQPKSQRKEALCLALVEHAKVPENWMNPSTNVRRTQANFCEVFLRDHLGSPSVYQKLGCTTPPSVRSLENILSDWKEEWVESSKKKTSSLIRKNV